MTDRKIVVLCGSTRFYGAFQRANYQETMAGKIVLSIGFYPGAGAEHGETVGITPEQKRDLDLLYFDKIGMAHEILVLNVNGYIGESTRREIGCALAREKRIRFLELGGTTGWLNREGVVLVREYETFVRACELQAVKILHSDIAIGGMLDLLGAPIAWSGREGFALMERVRGSILELWDALRNGVVDPQYLISDGAKALYLELLTAKQQRQVCE